MNYRSVIYIFLQLITATIAVAQANSSQPGLVCTASDGERKVAFVVPTPNFTLQAEQSVHPQLKPEFTAEWTGVLKIERAGKYCLRGDAKIFLSGREVQNSTNDVAAGELPLRIEYQRKPGGARLQLCWESEFFRYEPIPASAFAHAEESSEVAVCAQLARGRELVEEFNCIACHKSKQTIFHARQAPDLTGIGSRVKASWIAKWLENPRHFRSTAPMPVLLKSEKNRADMTAFLSTVVLETPVAELQHSNAPAGRELFQKIGCAACHDQEHNSLAGLGSKMSLSQIAHYLRNPLSIDPSGRMPDCFLKPNEPMQLASFLAESQNPDFEQAAPAGDANRGKMFFGIIGCANCHTLKVAGETVAPRFFGAPFEKLKPGVGCLSETPTQMLPDFRFTAEERAALNAFIASPDRSEAPVQDTHRTLKQFNCTACHEFNVPARFAFPANQAPPRLTDAGNKLRASWLQLVLNDKKRVRPWLAPRMPHFGTNTLDSLIAGLPAQAGAELGEGPAIAPTTVEQVSEGMALVGKGGHGLSCISCHDYRGQPAGADMRGPDLTEIFDRIRADWLRRWLYDPQRRAPGTPMPTFFAGLPWPEANHKITQLVYALSAGKNMPIPAGLNDDVRAYLLSVIDEPVVLRCFLTDASPRSICVGLPEQISYCFDAESCRFRFAWSGDFLDVKPTWANRGGLPPQILGTKFFIAPPVFPLRLGSTNSESQTKFLGYKLIDKIPEFRYEVNGVAVSERATLRKNPPALVRSFECQKANGDIWFNAGGEAPVLVDGKPIAPAEDNWCRIPESARGRFEVIIPIKQLPQRKTADKQQAQKTSGAVTSLE